MSKSTYPCGICGSDGKTMTFSTEDKLAAHLLKRHGVKYVAPESPPKGNARQAGEAKLGEAFDQVKAMNEVRNKQYTVPTLLVFGSAYPDSDGLDCAVVFVAKGSTLAQAEEAASDIKNMVIRGEYALTGIHSLEEDLGVYDCHAYVG